MTKALSDDWMLDHNFIDNDLIKPKKMEAWWANRRVCDIPLATPLTITSEVTIVDAIQLLKQEGFDMVPAMSNGNIAGVVTEGNMTSKILSGQIKNNDTVADAKVIYKNFRKVGMNDKLATVAHALNSQPFVLVVTEQRCFNGKSPGKVDTKTVVSGIITRIDILDYISKNEATSLAEKK